MRRAEVACLLFTTAIVAACGGEPFESDDAGPSSGGTQSGGASGSGGAGASGATGGAGGSAAEHDGGKGGASGEGGSAGGTCSPVPSATGCADGSREGFKSLASYPKIAACSGGWSAPGITSLSPPQCCREAGNDGARPEGEGCNVEDLCSAGWHVCTSAEEVGKLVKLCDLDTIGADAAGSIWITRQIVSPADGGAQCIAGGSNNVAGCGDIGANQPCPPLNRALQTVVCADNPPWFCGTATDGTKEAFLVAKSGPEHGGVLCCKDEI
jgi:hypothetical protein